MIYPFMEEEYNLIESVASTALTGCSYWVDDCQTAGVQLSEYISGHLARGGSIAIHERDNDEWHIVTYEQFKAALFAYIWHIDIEGDWDGYLDDSTTEMVLQLCCFGDVIYG